MSHKIPDGLTAAQRYEKNVILTASLRLNRRTDADIIEWLAAHAADNRQGYIKALIRAEIARQKADQS